MRQAADGELTLWHDFVGRYWRTLSGDRPWPTRSTSATWRIVRRSVVGALADVGLSASVWRDGEILPLAEHPSGQAGLVVLHTGSLDGRLPAPRVELVGRHEQAYQVRMLAAHGLLPHLGLLATPRGLLGQLSSGTRPEWLDHARTWINADGEPVLTAEPYRHGDGPGLTDEQARAVIRDVDGLPLRVTVHPGVWNDGTVLLVLQAGGRCVEPLPAVEPDCTEEREEDMRDVLELLSVLDPVDAEARRQVRATLRRPTQQSLTGLLAKVHADPDTLGWATRKLITHQLAGHIGSAAVQSLVGRTVERLNIPAGYAGTVLDEAKTRAYGEALADVPSTAETLDRAWCIRAAAAVNRDGEARHFPRLEAALRALATQQSQEAVNGR